MSRFSKIKGYRIPDCLKLVANWKSINDVTILWHEFIAKILFCYFFSLVMWLVQDSCQYHHWFWIDSGLKFYKGLTINLGIGNAPVSILINICRLGWVRNRKFGSNLPNKILLNAAKCQSCSFYRLWLIKRKPTGEMKLLPYSVPQD